MTRNIKGLRRFLALLMSALMVLGMCSFGYAADVLEDVDVDESVNYEANDEQKGVEEKESKSLSKNDISWKEDDDDKDNFKVVSDWEKQSNKWVAKIQINSGYTIDDVDGKYWKSSSGKGKDIDIDYDLNSDGTYSIRFSDNSEYTRVVIDVDTKQSSSSSQGSSPTLNHVDICLQASLDIHYGYYVDDVFYETRVEKDVPATISKINSVKFDYGDSGYSANPIGSTNWTQRNDSYEGIPGTVKEWHHTANIPNWKSLVSVTASVDLLRTSDKKTITINITFNNEAIAAANRECQNKSGLDFKVYDDVQELIAAPVQPGSLKITKSNNGAQMSAYPNASFYIDSANTPIDIGNGQSKTATGLTAGSHTISESVSSVPDGFTYKTDCPTKVTIENNKTTEITVTNTWYTVENVYGSVEHAITKTDEEDNSSLSGAVFTATHEDGETTVTSVQDTTTPGTYKFTFTKPGVYTITETTAPSGYVCPTESVGTVTVIEAANYVDTYNDTDYKCTRTYGLSIAEDSLVTLSNKKAPVPPTTGTVTINKVFEIVDPTPTAGTITFTLTNKDTNANVTVDVTCVNGAWTGSADDVPFGTYTISESDFDITGYTHTSTSYKVDNNIVEEITISANNASVTINATNTYEVIPPTPTTGTVTINKEFVNVDPTPTAGTITFTLTNKDTDADVKTKTVVVSYVNGAWTGSADDVPFGTYTISESDFDITGYTHTSTSYKVDNNIVEEITISANNASVTINATNTYEMIPPAPNTYDVTINKRFVVPAEGDGPEPITDYPDNFSPKMKLDGGANKTYPATGEYSEENGYWTFVFTGVEAGRYVIGEYDVDIPNYSSPVLSVNTEGTPVEYKDGTYVLTVSGNVENLDAINTYELEQSNKYDVTYYLVKDGVIDVYYGPTQYDYRAIHKIIELPVVPGYTVDGWYDPDIKVTENPDDVVAQLAIDLSGIKDSYKVNPDAMYSTIRNYTYYAFAEKNQPEETESTKPVVTPKPVEYSAYLLINKVDTQGNPVAGAGFTVTNGQTTQGSIGRTDAQGQLLMGLLDVGTFTITESTVPAGYVAGAPVTVNVTAANTRDNPCVVTIVNAKEGEQPTATPTDAPTETPSEQPTAAPTDAPSEQPSEEPTVSPTDVPTSRPTTAPTSEPGDEDVPKTGDNGLGYLYTLLGLSGLGMIALLLMYRKLRRN